MTRFWNKVAIKSSSECWIWQGAKFRDQGYGRIIINYKDVRAHRVSWELVNGPIPSGLLICHHCDNRLCVNPKHLFLGTHKDNNQDCVNKGRKHWQKQIDCKNGHLFTDTNIYFNKAGNRVCKACRRISDAKRYYKNLDKWG